jgi:hypothetical protein
MMNSPEEWAKEKPPESPQFDVAQNAFVAIEAILQRGIHGQSVGLRRFVADCIACRACCDGAGIR